MIVGGALLFIFHGLFVSDAYGYIDPGLFVSDAYGYIDPGLFVSDAYGYIDPGTGSIIIQAVIGALVGIGITLKIYWQKFKEIFSRANK